VIPVRSRKLLRQPPDRSIVHLIQDSRSVQVTGGRDWVVGKLGESQRAERDVVVRVRTDPGIWPTTCVRATLSKLTPVIERAARNLTPAARQAVISVVGCNSQHGSDHAAVVSGSMRRQVSDFSGDSGA
jgi:hypothetical protein